MNLNTGYCRKHSSMSFSDLSTGSWENFLVQYVRTMHWDDKHMQSCRTSIENGGPDVLITRTTDRTKIRRQHGVAADVLSILSVRKWIAAVTKRGSPRGAKQLKLREAGCKAQEETKNIALIIILNLNLTFRLTFSYWL